MYGSDVQYYMQLHQLSQQIASRADGVQKNVPTGPPIYNPTMPLQYQYHPLLNQAILQNQPHTHHHHTHNLPTNLHNSTTIHTNAPPLHNSHSLHATTSLHSPVLTSSLHHSNGNHPTELHNSTSSLHVSLNNSHNNLSLSGSNHSIPLSNSQTISLNTSQPSLSNTITLNSSLSPASPKSHPSSTSTTTTTNTQENKSNTNIDYNNHNPPINFIDPPLTHLHELPPLTTIQHEPLSVAIEELNNNTPLSNSVNSLSSSTISINGNKKKKEPKEVKEKKEQQEKKEKKEKKTPSTPKEPRKKKEPKEKMEESGEGEGKEKDKLGKRGRKPVQDPPYTKLYKQPWLDGWATCKRLALEYVEETKLLAHKSNTPLKDIRKLPSQSDLTNGNSGRVWLPMELILARAFLKEANLVNTSTKKGAVLKEETMNIDQLPELISKSVLSSTHANLYQPKERKKKDPNEPKKEKKKKSKKAKTSDTPVAGSDLSSLLTSSLSSSSLANSSSTSTPSLSSSSSSSSFSSSTSSSSLPLSLSLPPPSLAFPSLPSLPLDDNPTYYWK